MLSEKEKFLNNENLIIPIMIKALNDNPRDFKKAARQIGIGVCTLHKYKKKHGIFKMYKKFTYIPVTNDIKKDNVNNTINNRAVNT